jgi:hypothetical protein
MKKQLMAFILGIVVALGLIIGYIGVKPFEAAIHKRGPLHGENR